MAAAAEGCRALEQRRHALEAAAKVTHWRLEQRASAAATRWRGAAIRWSNRRKTGRRERSAATLEKGAIEQGRWRRAGCTLRTFGGGYSAAYPGL
jgi:hypothetical protein